MQATAVTLLLVASSTLGQYNNRRIVYYQPQPQPAFLQALAGHGAVKKDELEYQQQAFKQWWGDELVIRHVLCSIAACFLTLAAWEAPNSCSLLTPAKRLQREGAAEPRIPC